MAEKKFSREEILCAIDNVMEVYGSDLQSDLTDIERARCMGAIMALERLKRDLGMPKMRSRREKSVN